MKGDGVLEAWPGADSILPVILNAGTGAGLPGGCQECQGVQRSCPSAPLGQFPVRHPRDPAILQRKLTFVILQDLPGSWDPQGASVACLEAREKLAQGVSWGTLGGRSDCNRNDRQGNQRGMTRGRRSRQSG